MLKIKNARALFQERDRVWIAKGNCFYTVDYKGNLLGKKITLGNIFENHIAKIRVLRQAFRLGIHHIIKLRNGNILVTKKKITFLLDNDGSILSVFKGYSGNKPFNQGICETPEGIIFFAEYMQNFDRKITPHLYRSCDGGKTFQSVLSFSKGSVRHIHFVNYDKYEKKIWIGTGDKNSECKLMSSSDNGENWDVVGEGSQKWRSVGLCFSQDYIIWGTDAGSVEDLNFIYAMHRKSKIIKSICEIEGPCHGCTQQEGDLFYFSTGIEGGSNEKDKMARIKRISLNDIENVFECRKDRLPYVIQFGVIRFPLKNFDIKKLVYTTYGLKDGGETVYFS